MMFSTISDIRKAIRAAFQEEFARFGPADSLLVECSQRCVRVFFASAQASRGMGESTSIDCRIHLDSRQMWIASLYVAPSLRLQGLGRELVRVAEQMARVCGVETVKILSRPSSLGFWRQLEYTPEPNTARILWKILTDSRSETIRNGACRSAEPAADS